MLDQTEKFIFLESKQISNYYHCLVDFLPIIYQIYCDSDQKKIQFDFDVSENNIILCKKIINCLFNENVLINTSDDLTNKKIINYNNIKQSIGENFIEYLKKIRSIKNNTHKRILIKRDNRYINSNILMFLKDKNFQEISFENYSINEQASLVYNADYVFASHGAGLTNIIFANKNTKIVELNNGFNIKCYKWLSKFCEGSYETLVSDCYDSGKHNETKNNIFDMNIESFQECYRKIVI